MLQPPPPQPLPPSEWKFLQFVAVDGVRFEKALAALALGVLAAYSPFLWPFEPMRALRVGLHLLNVLVLAVIYEQYAAYVLRRRLTRAMLSVPLAGAVLFAFLPWNAVLVDSPESVMTILIGLGAALTYSGSMGRQLSKKGPLAESLFPQASEMQKGGLGVLTGVAAVVVFWFFARWLKLGRFESVYIGSTFCTAYFTLGFLRIYSALASRRADRMGWPQAGWGMTSIALAVFAPAMAGLCFYTVKSLAER